MAMIEPKPKEIAVIDVRSEPGRPGIGCAVFADVSGSRLPLIGVAVWGERDGQQEEALLSLSLYQARRLQHALLSAINETERHSGGVA